MAPSDYEVLVDLTCWVRHLQGWEDGRRALLDIGIDPGSVICTYLGPGGGYATCDFLLSDGRFVTLDIDREPATGRIFVPSECVEDIGGNEPWEQLARQIVASGEVPEFDARVRDRYEQEYRPREPVIRPKAK